MNSVLKNLLDVTQRLADQCAQGDWESVVITQQQRQQIVNRIKQEKIAFDKNDEAVLKSIIKLHQEAICFLEDQQDNNKNTLLTLNKKKKTTELYSRNKKL